MWIRNTSKYPTDEVRELIKFGSEGIDMRHVCVNVKGGKFPRGVAYPGVPEVSNAPKTARYLIVLIIPSGPFERIEGNSYHLKRSPDFWIETWREWVVAVAAHEAKHIEQYRENLPRSEVRTQTHSYRRLLAYRAQNPASTASLAVDRPMYRLVGHKGRSRELSYHRAPILTYAVPGLYRGGSIRFVRFRPNNRGTRGADWLIYKHGIPQLHLGLAPSLMDAKAILQKELEKDAGVYPLPVCEGST